MHYILCQDSVIVHLYTLLLSGSYGNKTIRKKFTRLWLKLRENVALSAILLSPDSKCPAAITRRCIL